MFQQHTAQTGMPPASERQQLTAWAVWLPAVQPQHPRRPQLPQLQHLQLLPPLPETACWPSESLEPQHGEPEQHAGLPQCPHPSQPDLHWQVHGGGGGSGGSGGSPCLPHFECHEIQALVEVLHPPSLDPPSPELLAEAPSCAAGTAAPASGAALCTGAVSAAASGATAPAACLWGMPAGQALCSGAPCGSPIVRLSVPPAPSPPPHALPADGWAGSAAAWQQVWQAAVAEGERRPATVLATTQLLPLPAAQPAAPAPSAPSPCPLQGSADPTHAHHPEPQWEWPEELFAGALHCPPSPAFSWMV
jgi:hypothetical protein